MMANGVIIVDKEPQWTSFDVCAKLRSVLKTRKIGHAGTLDPMATGVLTVLVGSAAKACEFASADEKEYLAGLRLGVTTDTQDITGTVLRASGDIPSRAEVEDALSGFRGEISQIPPMFSAVKIDGERLYSLARRGEEIDRPARGVEIKDLAVEAVSEGGQEYLLRVVCSKGTYIRTLCHDLGKKLGCGGVMSSLRRTRSGIFTLDGALTVGEIVRLASEGRADRALRPVDTLFMSYPQITLDEKREILCKNGVYVDICDFPLDFGVCCRVYSIYGEFIMLGVCFEDGGRKRLRQLKRFSGTEKP